MCYLFMCICLHNTTSASDYYHFSYVLTLPDLMSILAMKNSLLLYQNVAISKIDWVL